MGAEQLIGSELGSYRIEEHLGQGGFAWVFRARSADGRQVAMKVLKPRYSGDAQFEARFRNEVETASRLEHPNILRILDVGQDRDMTYYVTEVYPDSLASILDRDGPLSEERLINVATDVARALATAHRAGIVHRDIKIDNIMLRDDGSAVVTDFGISRAISGYVTATGANMTIGTPHYLSPEQAQGRALDGRADLYALGITLYRSATGELPFRSSDWFELARMHVEVDPIPPSRVNQSLSRRMERIILRCMAKHPDDRYSSAEELLDELEAIDDRDRRTTQFGAFNRHEGSSADRRAAWRKLGAIAAVVAIVGLLVAIALL